MAIGPFFGHETPFFVVTSTGKGCDPRPCIESVKSQTYPYYRHRYIGADMKTAAEAVVWAGPRTSVDHSPLTVVENVYRYWQTLRDSDVVVWLDGDDRLEHPGVLEFLARIYRERDPWLTYGSFRFEPPQEEAYPHFGMRYQLGADVRGWQWRASHLKTFRAGLVKRVREESLRRLPANHIGPVPPEEGWTEYCTDRVFMLPMLEMAGERYEAIPEVLSVYNFGASFSATNRDPEKTAAEETERRRIHSLPKYERLKERPW